MYTHTYLYICFSEKSPSSKQFATHLHFFGQWESNGALFCLLKSRQLATLCRSLCHKNSFDPLWKNCGLLLCYYWSEKCTTVASTCIVCVLSCPSYSTHCYKLWLKIVFYFKKKVKKSDLVKGFFLKLALIQIEI